MRLFLFFLGITFPALAIEVSYSDTMCRILERHVLNDDVAYQPGVDIHGKAVVPADLKGESNFQLPETIKIPLSVDLAQEFGLPEYTNDELVAPLGILEITKDGRVLQNGRDLTGRAQAICNAETARQSE